MMQRMIIAIHIARRELRGGFASFKIFLACLVLGVAAITGVGSVSNAVKNGIKIDAQKLLGGDLSVRQPHQPISNAAKAFILKTAQLSQVMTLRAMTRRESGGKRRSLIELKAVDRHYPLYGEIVFEPKMPVTDALGKKNGTMGVAIDKALAQRFDLSLGDKLKIGNSSFEFRAIIIKEPDRSVRFATFGPRVIISAEGLRSTGLISVGSLITYHYRISLPAKVDANDWVDQLNSRFPQSAWRIISSENSLPGFDRFLKRVTQFLIFVGLTALLVGGVGIANAVHNFLERRVGVIAILKCLGASGDFLFLVYLIQVLFLTTLGILIGIILGAAAPIVTAFLLPEFIPITLPLKIYWEPIIIAAIYGYATSLIFTIWPLGQAQQTKPARLFRSLIIPLREYPSKKYVLLAVICVLIYLAILIISSNDTKLAIWFVLGCIGTVFIFYASAQGLITVLRKLPKLRPVILRIGIENLGRAGNSTSSVIVSLGLGLTILVAIAQIEANFTRQINEQIPSTAPSYYFIDIQPHQSEEFVKIVRNTPEITKFEFTPMVRGRIVRVAGQPIEKVKYTQDVAWAINGDRGLTYARHPPVGTKLVSGKWWPENYIGSPLISLDANIARGIGVQIGDTISLNVLGKEITATVANLRNIDWKTLGMNFVFIFAPGTLEKAPHSIISTVYSDNVDHEEKIQQIVTDAFPNISAIRVKDALDNANRILNVVANAIRIIASVTLLAGILVLAGTLGSQHQRRLNEAVILKIMGATRIQILKTYIIEHLILGILTLLVSSIIGFLVSWLVVTQLMHADFEINFITLIFTVSVTLLSTSTLGLISTWRVLSLKSVDAFKVK